jgi:acyl-coenzyme A synthetase/AMP-(fatty) acid ligase
VPVAFLVVPELQYGLSDVARVVDRVRRHLDVALVRTKRPVAYYVVEELPAGATGKVQRRALRQNDIPVRYHLNCR